MVIDVTDFDLEVIERSVEIPVLVDFWAEWCRPCMALGRTLEALLDGEFRDRLVVAKVDTEAFPEIARQFDVRTLPTVKLVRGRVVVDGFEGVRPRTAIRELLLRHCATEP